MKSNHHPTEEDRSILRAVRASAAIAAHVWLTAATLALAGCAGTPAITGALSTPITVGASPEQQIAIGAQTVTATTTLATVLLRDQRITVTQAKSFRNMLVAAGESLKDANTELLACRATTVMATPDPCWPKVSDVVGVALANIGGVRAALATK